MPVARASSSSREHTEPPRGRPHRYQRGGRRDLPRGADWARGADLTRGALAAAAGGLAPDPATLAAAGARGVRGNPVCCVRNGVRWPSDCAPVPGG